MTYSRENETATLEAIEIAISITMGHIKNGKENIQTCVSKLLEDRGLNIPVDDVIISARQNLENPRCCSDG